MLICFRIKFIQKQEEQQERVAKMDIYIFSQRGSQHWAYGRLGNIITSPYAHMGRQGPPNGRPYARFTTFIRHFGQIYPLKFAVRPNILRHMHEFSNIKLADVRVQFFRFHRRILQFIRGFFFLLSLYFSILDGKRCLNCFPLI